MCLCVFLGRVGVSFDHHAAALDARLPVGAAHGTSTRVDRLFDVFVFDVFVCGNVCEKLRSVGAPGRVIENFSLVSLNALPWFSSLHRFVQR